MTILSSAPLPVPTATMNKFDELFRNTVYDLPSPFFDDLADYAYRSDDDFLMEQDGLFAKKLYDSLYRLDLTEKL